MTAKLTVDESDVRTAHKVVWDVKAASVAILQRHLCLGYLRAGAILDELERRGIVGPADVNGFKIPRRVLVAPEGCDAGSLPTPDRPDVGTDADATLATVLARLKALKRYSVGNGDDGDGFMYEDNIESVNGDWIEAADVDELIAELEGKGGAA
jgi:hypothetical protein